MKMMRPNYYDMNDWTILDRMVVNMYDEDETPINIFKVKIGVLDAETININNTYSKRTFDIVRWLSEGEYERLKRNAGVIIW